MKQNLYRMITIIICLVMVVQFATMVSAAENIEPTVITEGTAATRALTTYRFPGDDSGRWPGDGITNIAYNVDYFENLDLPSAWLLQTVSSVPVGVIDTGIKSNHEDLASSYMGGALFGSGTGTYSVDEVGHGTAVAGVIAGSGYNTAGSAGVCWSAHLKSLKVVSLNSAGQKSYNNDHLAAAITYANSIGIKILNISLGKFSNNSAVKNAIENFNGLVICSAGNENRNTDASPHYPSTYSCDNIICVGAVNTEDEIWVETAGSVGSNYGATTVDVFAPGYNVRSTNASGGYEYATGTSMAAPHVTGLAALIWQVAPDLTAAQVKAAIMNNVDTLSCLSGKCVSGGRINAYKALRSVMPQRDARVLTGDINGDGVEDQVVTGSLNDYLRLSVFLGKGDGTFEQADHTFSTKIYAQSDPLFIGDVNGDGCDDVVLHWVSSSKRQLMTFFGDIYGHLNLNSDNQGYNSAINLKYDMTNNPSKSFLLDVTNDGCADFVCHMKMNNGCRGFWVYKGIPGGTGFNTTAVTTDSTRTFIYSDPVFMDDVNGDDIPDLVVHWASVSDSKRQLLTYTSTGTGKFQTPVNLATSNTHDESVYPSQLMLGDSTGDGLADFVVMWKNSQGKRCILQYNGTENSSGQATFTTGTHLLASTNNYVQSDPVYLEDVTGDGRKDVIVYWISNTYRQMLVYKSLGNGFASGVNFSSTKIDSSTYPSDHRFVQSETTVSGKEFVFRWAHYQTEVMHFHSFHSDSNGQFYGLPAVSALTYFPFYVYR